MKRPLGVLALALFAIAPFAHAQKQRAVRIPAPPCSFSLSFDYSLPVSDAGLAGGNITVTPSASNCTSWYAFSPVSWIGLAALTPTRVVITVAPNPTFEARSAVARIAGVDFVVTQQPQVQPPFVETGIVKNGAFHTDIANWEWQDRFPNGIGTVTWAQGIDANANSASGSMRLRNTQLEGPGMQRLQCVTTISAGQVYSFDFAYRMQPSGGLMQVSVFDLDTPDCSGPYSLRFTKQYFPNGTDAFRRDSNAFRLGGAARSVLIVFASKTSTGSPFDLYIDDVAMKQQ